MQSLLKDAVAKQGYVLKESDEVKPVISRAMKEKKPTIIEAHVVPFEPPMPKWNQSLFAIWLNPLQRGSHTAEELV
jgi:thiamine pyrophosphate-dependent acetolactate synthase large subunit-like protein